MQRHTTLAATLLLPLALALAACGGGASPSPAAPTLGPTVEAPTEQPSEAAGGGATVEAADVGTVGTVLVDGASGMTLYTFTKDVKDSGVSACTGGCLTTWPALTVPDDATPPTGGDGVTGTLATIERDDGTYQVTYNGLPLYFFKSDAAPGDANGVYENWEVVAP
jgi:predicted lipoprotein with Yx(FWY)xxD motif